MGPKNDEITINGNDIHDNGWDAIRLDLIGNYWNPDFETNPGPYTCLDGSENVEAYSNKFYDNENDISVIGSPTNGFVLDAKKNYWGTVNPYFDAIVSGDVDYRPWYIDEAMTKLNEEVTSCYPGDIQTDSYGTNVGECVSGVKERTCQADGTWGEDWDITTPAVGPVTEICDDGLDNDCDSYTDIHDPDCYIGTDYYTKSQADSLFATLSDIADFITESAADLKYVLADDFNTLFAEQFSSKDTDDLKEGESNLYFTTARVIEAVGNWAEEKSNYFTVAEIDTQGEMEDIWGVTIATDAELQANINVLEDADSSLQTQITSNDNAISSLENRALHDDVDGIDIYLHEGWNTFKLPWFVLTGTNQAPVKLDLSDDYSVENVLSSLKNQETEELYWDYIAYYDGNGWKVYIPGVIEDDFTEFPTDASNADYDFHIHMTSGARLSIGIEPSE